MKTTKKYIAGPGFKSGSDNRARRPVLGGHGTYLVEAEADMSVWTFIDDKEAWEQANREHKAEQIDASDEERLAAGWVQQIVTRTDAGSAWLDRWEVGAPGRIVLSGLSPAPGVAGKWRLHVSGAWVRWVRL